MLKGVLHLHSTFSDGELTLQELRDELVRAGCRFACMTDHADAFYDKKLAEYVRACAAHSDAQFQFIPGLEYGCANRMHILGYGATSLIASTDPQEVIRQIAGLGGLAVIAHPKDDAFAAIEAFEILPNGIETWNSKYDGRYAPRAATFALLERLKARRPDMTAFYGQDLHWRKQYRGLFTLAGCETPGRDAVLDALRRGDYAGVKDDLRLPSDGRLPADVLSRLNRAHDRSQRLRTVITRAKKWADRLGIRVPAGMKAQLRRMF